MKTTQLKKMVYNHRDLRRVFRGVYACDALPRRIPANKTVALIANTDPAHKSGQHWVAYYYTPTCVYYFDSYGRPPCNRHLDRMMKYRKRQRVFGRRLQGLDGVCGLYCLYFLWAMTYQKDFSQFGDDLNANDRLVRKLTDATFKR